MYFKRLTCAAAVLTCLFAVQPVAATILVSGGVASQAQYTFGGVGTSDPKSATITAPGSIAVSSATGYNIGGTRPTISVHSSVDATWESADAGSFDVAWGFDADTYTSPEAISVSTMNGTPNAWSYNFIASGDGIFTMNYALSANDAYLLGGFVGVGGLGNAFFPGAALSATGALVVPLIAGQSYNLGLRNGGNASNSSGIYVQRAATGAFDWAITYNDVPEPASWAMMIAGLGLVGFSVRRRSRKASFA